MTHHVALFGGDIIGEATTEAEAIALASPNGAPHYFYFYDADDGPRVQGYAENGMGVWIVDPL